MSSLEVQHSGKLGTRRGRTANSKVSFRQRDRQAEFAFFFRPDKSPYNDIHQCNYLIESE